MVGKTWSEKEEKYFWTIAMSDSPKRVGKDRARPEMSWKQLAKRMQRDMGADARRDYTETMLCRSFSSSLLLLLLRRKWETFRLVVAIASLLG